ncbi:MAG: amidohydrolase family protein, partial [Candidatus Bathyarchaeia archaeon]
CMREGARGFSTGWYPPAYWAETSEIIELSKVVAKYGGIYTTHLRSHPYWVEEAFKVGEEAGIPVEIAHYDGRGVQEARTRGIDVTYDAYCYTAGSSLLGQVLPPWTYEGGVEAMLERLRDEKVRERVREELKKQMAATGFPDWRLAVIAFLPNEKYKKYEGMNIEEVARSERSDPVDVVCDLLSENDGLGMYVYMNGRKESYIFNNLKNPYNYVMSDGWGLAPYEPIQRGKPHPRCYGNFPRLLGWYVRECGAVTLQEAIRKISWGPAQKMGLADRGLLREGMWADITVFDPGKVMDTATYSDPHKYPVGIEYVLVNGRVVVERGKHTGVRAGKIL